MKNRDKRPKTANHRLDSTVSALFIQDLWDLCHSGIGEYDFEYLGKVFLSKYLEPSKEGAEARRSKAIAKWLEVETNNAVTNNRLRSAENDSNIIFGEVTVGTFFKKVAEIVLRVAGPAPSYNLADGGFSGGATTSKPRKEGHPALKFKNQAHATPQAWELFFALIDEGSPWANHIAAEWQQVVVRGNVMFTVPKTSDIDRVACKEPDLNVFFQKGFGDQLRRKLKQVGIDLNDQRINADLAREGSISRELATLDLSSASDSVTCALVERVMPKTWVFGLAAVRSPVTDIDGEIHKNEMFSSMGNGFTFELESLLFYAICRAVQYFTGVKGIVSVYGDDLVVPTAVVEPLIEALAYCGFKTNPDKSFWDRDEPFRESCGSHWIDGRDVRPFYLREPLRTLSDLIHILNALALWGARVGGVVDPRVESLHSKWRRLVPEDLWGGQDPMSRYSLVTGHRPRRKLQPVVQDESQHHVGGYLAWLQRKARDRVEPVTVSEAVVTTALFRTRANREEVNDQKPYFAGLSDCVEFLSAP